MDIINWIKGLRGTTFQIDSRDKLEEAARTMGVLPFFPNAVRGLSVDELAAPGMLFGGNHDEGCWEWKGPVIRSKTSAYGKFFNRKAGFVSLDLLPYFLKYRRASYPIKPFSTEEMLLDIIRENGDISSTELKNFIYGFPSSARKADDLPEISGTKSSNPSKRKGLESPLQRLQMGGWILISDFQYKTTKRGERYGWGVARYSTPEFQFNNRNFNVSLSPEESLLKIISEVKKRLPWVSEKSLKKILK